MEATQYDGIFLILDQEDLYTGETLDLPEFDGKTGDGWNLFCVDGYPLGWGKFKNGSLKNKYLAGWRWQ